jgi:uncharacterized membrane protein YfcA
VDYGQIAVVLLAVGIGFFAKGLTGIGGPMFAIPVLASFMGVEFAVAVIAIPTLVANVWLLWQNRAAAGSVRRYLIPMLIAGTFGILLGVWLLISVDDRWLSLALALVVIAYIIWYLTNPRFQLSEEMAQRLAAPGGFIGGGMHGATGISAPVVATYTHSLNLPRTGFVFAVTVPFAVLGAVQIVSLAVVNAYDTERIVAGLVAIIPVVIVLPIGGRIGERLSQQAFQIVVLVVLGVAALRLLWSVFA